MRKPPIYLDHHSATPVDERVLDAMLPWWRSQANAHSPHALGRAAARAVDTAREQVARLVNARPDDVVFTSGATEAAAMAVRAFARPRSRAVASAIEHPCVLDAVHAIEPETAAVILPVDADGLVDVDQAGEAIGRDACMLAVMAVNNEIGTVQPVAGLGAVAAYAGVPFLCDLSQAAGRLPVDVEAWNVGAGLLSSQKMYGPQGIGALIRRGTVPPLLRSPGGGQEGGARSGTLPVALCVGFGQACAIAVREMEAEVSRIGSLSRRLLSILRAGLPAIRLNGSAIDRVPHNLNVSVPGLDAQAMCDVLAGVAISTGSACSSGALGHSPVLIAIGLDDDRMRGAFRIGLGRATTMEEIEEAAAAIVRTAASMGAAGVEAQTG